MTCILNVGKGYLALADMSVQKNKSPKESINAQENGKLYCDTLLDIYPIFKEFIDKWDNFIDCQCIFYRFSRAIGPYQYKGLLYNQKYQKNEQSETKN
ncbi:unknown [Prevotella sp. CAG:1092]|nr:unknown [Prevotella sp. CAG:1092]